MRDVRYRRKLEFAVARLDAGIGADPGFSLGQGSFTVQSRSESASSEEEQGVVVIQALGDLLETRRQVSRIPMRARRQRQNTGVRRCIDRRVQVLRQIFELLLSGCAP